MHSASGCICQVAIGERAIQEGGYSKLWLQAMNYLIIFSFQEEKQNGEAEKETTETEPDTEANKVTSTGDSLPETEPMEA